MKNWLGFLAEGWGLFVSTGVCSPGLLFYSHRPLIPAVVPARLSGSISAGRGGGRRPGTAPGCTVLHTPASARPAPQTSCPPTVPAWGRLSWARGRGEGWSYDPPRCSNQICSLLLCDSSHQPLGRTLKQPRFTSHEWRRHAKISDQYRCYDLFIFLELNHP